MRASLRIVFLAVSFLAFACTDEEAGGNAKSTDSAVNDGSNTDTSSLTEDTSDAEDTGSHSADPGDTGSDIDTLDSESMTQSEEDSNSNGSQDTGDFGSGSDSASDQGDSASDQTDYDDTTDTGSASDTDTDSYLPCECTINSGYPCHCENLGGTCEDGSACVLLNKEADDGVCLRSCAGQGDDATCVVNMDCFAQGRCVLSMDSDEQSYCGYRCEVDGECPAPLVCDKSIGIGICAPDVAGLIAQGPCDECPLGQWPCPCDVSLENPCADGSVCATGEEFAPYGACLKICEKSSECFVDMKCGIEQNGKQVFTGEQLCGVTFSSDPDHQYCGWFCEEDYDCPPNEKCALINPDSELKLCFGDAEKIDGDGAGQ